MLGQPWGGEGQPVIKGSPGVVKACRCMQGSPGGARQGCREVRGSPVCAGLSGVTTKGGCRINDLRSLGRRLFLKEITFFFRSFAI